MTGRLKKHADTLHFMAKAKPKVNKALIEARDKELINCLCECALNVLKGNVPLSHDQKRKLARHKTGLRTLIAPKTSGNKKKKFCKQEAFFQHC